MHGTAAVRAAVALLGHVLGDGIFLAVSVMQEEYEHEYEVLGLQLS